MTLKPETPFFFLFFFFYEASPVSFALSFRGDDCMRNQRKGENSNFVVFCTSVILGF